MSKSIPPVRKWKVRYWNGKELYLSVFAEGPNKEFARWHARDDLMAQGLFMDVWENCDRITVSLAKEQANVSRAGDR